MKKRILAVSLLCCFSIFAFAACSSDINNNTGKTGTTLSVTPALSGAPANGTTNSNNTGTIRRVPNNAAPINTRTIRNRNANGTNGSVGGAVGEVLNGVGNAVGDVGRGVGNAVSDVGRGVGNAVNRVGSGVNNAVNSTTNGTNYYNRGNGTTTVR